MPVRFSLNWFVGCYVVYYLIHSLLNSAIEKMSSNTMKKYVLTLFVVYSIMGLVGQVAYYYTNLVGFICIHYFVTYYKKYVTLEKKHSRDVKIIAVSIATISIWILAINGVSRYTGKLSKYGVCQVKCVNFLIFLWWSIYRPPFLQCSIKRKLFINTFYIRRFTNISVNYNLRNRNVIFYQ